MALSYLKSCYAEEEQTDSLLFQRTELQTMSEKCRESNFWQKGKAAVVNWESNAALQASLYGPCNLPQSHPFSTGHIPHQPSFEPYPTLQIFRSKRQGWLEMLTGLLAYWEESGGWEGQWCADTLLGPRVGTDGREEWQGLRGLLKTTVTASCQEEKACVDTLAELKARAQ